LLIPDIVLLFFLALSFETDYLGFVADLNKSSIFSQTGALVDYKRSALREVYPQPDSSLNDHVFVVVVSFRVFLVLR